MKIFDCFMYYDEDLILDLRLNCLSKYVDYFVIVESKYTHSGAEKKLSFDLNKFSFFKNKIIYVILETVPNNLFEVKKKDDIPTINWKLIMNAVYRENLQRNTIVKGLVKADEEDIIIISDIDEIPDLELNNIKTISNKIILFKQKYFHYKLNLLLKNIDWMGSKACKKKNLISPQWLRNIKDKKYPFWRIDTFFSERKYQDIKILDKGGWHFSNLKKPIDIEKKMKTYLHHREFELNRLNLNRIEEIVSKRIPIYNLNNDMKSNKFDLSGKLTLVNKNELPSYVRKNIQKYKDWLD